MSSEYACVGRDTTDTPWPQWLINSFGNKPQFELTGLNLLYGPYTRLLYHLFGVEGPFEIIPQYYVPRGIPDDSTSVDMLALFTVKLDNHPVLIFQVEALRMGFGGRKRMTICVISSAIFAITSLHPDSMVSVHSGLAWPFMNT